MVDAQYPVQTERGGKRECLWQEALPAIEVLDIPGVKAGQTQRASVRLDREALAADTSATGRWHFDLAPNPKSAVNPPFQTQYRLHLKKFEIEVTDSGQSS